MSDAREPVDLGGLSETELARLRHWWTNEAGPELDFLRKLDELTRIERWERTGLSADARERLRALGANRTDEFEYLIRIEELAKRVVSADVDQWSPDDVYTPRDGATGLEQAIVRLAAALRYVHYDGDGCLDGDAAT